MSEAKRESKGPVRGYFFDKSVVVTGASSGIGHDVALAFGEQGAQVALLARRRVQLEELAHKINKAGGKALALDCDVTDRARVFWAVDQVKEAFGKVDILINSAGLLIAETVEQMRPEDLEKMMAVNVFGALNAMQAVLPVMRKAKSGNIVNISSLAGRRGVSPQVCAGRNDGSAPRRAVQHRDKSLAGDAGRDRHSHGAQRSQARHTQGRIRDDGDAGTMGDVGGTGGGRLRAHRSGRPSRRRSRRKTRVAIPRRN
jgi:NADP-dependent 3-hydroxy acid dehydrogenase YdfG